MKNDCYALLWAAAAAGRRALAQDFPGTKILFETGKAELPATAADDLKTVADYLAANAAEKVHARRASSTPPARPT